MNWLSNTVNAIVFAFEKLCNKFYPDKYNIKRKKLPQSGKKAAFLWQIFTGAFAVFMITSAIQSVSYKNSSSSAFGG